MKQIKKTMILALLIFIGIAGTYAQVTIGDEVAPRKGSILDLKKTSTTGYLGGLLLPNVEILDLGFIPANFTDASLMSGYNAGKGVDSNPDLAGTLVYNTLTNDAKNIRPGVYLWDGDGWQQAGNSASMKLESDPGEFDKDGGSQEISVNNPACSLPGDYTYTLMMGGGYASVNPESSSDGKFTVTFDQNTTAAERKAIVMVSDVCGNSSTFVFTQGFDAALCGAAVSVPAIACSNGSTLCTGGAAYLYLNGSIGSNDTNDYIWTLGGMEVGRGTAYTATRSGRYTVYYKAVGCSNNSGDFTLTSSPTPASQAVRIIINGNNGYVCDPGETTTVIAQANGTETIEWFKDGQRQASLSGQEQIQAGVGVWFAVAREGANCWSEPSNEAIVQLDANAGSPVTMPVISVNGETNPANYVFCQGGMARLEVSNPDASVSRYTWYAENTEIGNGTSVYYSVPSNLPNVIIRCRAEGSNCSQEAIIMKSIAVTQAPAAPHIIGLDVLCAGEVTLTANASGVSNPQYIWYRGGLGDTEAQTVLPETGQNLTARSTGIYQVAVKEGNCISRKSPVKRVELSDFTALNWVQTHTTAYHESTLLFEVNATNGPVTYQWEATNATLANTGGNRTNVILPSTGSSAVVKVTATNECGSSVIQQAITLQSNCATPTLPTPAANQTLNGVVGTTVKMPVMVQDAINPAYRWYMNGAAMNTTTYPTATTATLNWTPASTGSYEFYCVVNNVCVSGTSSQVTSKKYTVVVTANPANLTTGTGAFTGKACFDIAYSNDNTNSCGSLSSRTSQRTDFSLTTEQDPAAGSVAAPYTGRQVYTFKVSGSGISNLRFVAVDAGGDVIESITPKANYSGSLANGTVCKATVVYKSSLNSSLRGLTTANAKTVKLYAVYTVSGTDRSVVLTVKLQDCACCGAKIDSGWLTFMCHNLGADETLDPFTPAPGLHGAKYRFGAKNPSYTMAQDQSNSGAISPDWKISSTAAFPFQTSGNWSEENNPCPEGWRLPTQAEWNQVSKTTNNIVTRIGGTSWNESTTNYMRGIKFGHSLFLPAAGSRNGDNGQLINRANRGFYWSSTWSSLIGSYLNVNTNGGSAGFTSFRSQGCSVRCVSK